MKTLYITLHYITLQWRSVTLICGALEEHLLAYISPLTMVRFDLGMFWPIGTFWFKNGTFWLGTFWLWDVLTGYRLHSSAVVDFELA